MCSYEALFLSDLGGGNMTVLWVLGKEGTGRERSWGEKREDKTRKKNEREICSCANRKRAQ